MWILFWQIGADIDQNILSSAFNRTKIPDLAIWFWFTFTTSLVVWWLIFSLQTLSEFQRYVEDPSSLSKEQAAAKHLFERRHRMLLWEGAILVALIAGGGGTLMYLLKKDRKKNQQVKTFFANFSHDLKTSIARLRLDSQILAEKIKVPMESLDRLQLDHARLEMQLENSLYMANQEHFRFVVEKIRLSELFKYLRLNFEDMSFSLKNDVELSVDRRAIDSIFKNLIQNSYLHGQATFFSIEAKQLSGANVQLTCKDNGRGTASDIAKALGKKIVFSESPNANGIGLFIVRQLLDSMGGKISFRSAEDKGASAEFVAGFAVEIQLPGRVLS